MVYLRDPAIMRSIMCAEGALRTPGLEEEKEWIGEWVLLFRTDGIWCLSGGQNVPARVLLMLNGTGRWIIPCTVLSLDKFKGSPTARHPGRMSDYK
ncbi:hypothetical protein NQZ68_011407 [Dissostichus eleginoides]|nr:hypothetical protein NQZ68_011407 [Dissostichus eleginoides]